MNVQLPAEQLETDHSPLRKYLIGGAALVVALGGYWYFNQDDAAPKPRKLAIPVRVGEVTQRDMAVVEHTLGTVVPFTMVQIAPRVSGVIDAADFTEGQMVKKGDLLFEIDPRPYQAAYKNAVATEADAKAKAERFKRLFAQNAVGAQDEDDAQAAYAVAQSNADAARLNLEFTKIRAPVDGKTGPILVQAGNTVIANLTTTPLVTIDQIRPIKVSFNLPQSDLPRIQARQKTPQGLVATVNLQGQGGEQLQAPVDFVSNAVNNISGTIELRATFKNADAALVPGQLVNVTVELNNIPHALVVPHEAVNTGPDGQFVYAIENGIAVEKPVAVQFEDEKETAVQGDVKPGDKVVTDGQLRLVPDAKVVVEGAPKAKGKGTGRKRRGGKPA